MKGFTREAFKKWLSKNKEKRFVCGDEALCPLAQFILSLDKDIESSFVNEDLYGYTKRGKEKEYIEYEKRLPEWARKFVRKFDALADNSISNRVLGSYILEKKTIP